MPNCMIPLILFRMRNVEKNALVVLFWWAVCFNSLFGSDKIRIFLLNRKLCFSINSIPDQIITHYSRHSPMAIATAVSNKFTLRQDSFKGDKLNGSIVPVSVLPDRKEWIKEHDLLMLMLDGCVLLSLIIEI
jgi:hypothetical protein